MAVCKEIFFWKLVAKNEVSGLQNVVKSSALTTKIKSPFGRMDSLFGVRGLIY